jgi:hypothetical protein
MWEDKARPTAAVMSSDIEGRNNEECPGGSMRLALNVTQWTEKGLVGGVARGYAPVL